MTVVSKGKQKSPYRLVLYGQPGMRKSSFMACAEDVLFIDPNKNTHRLSVSRVDVNSVEDIKSALDEVESKKIPCKTLVLDEYWAMEELASQKIIKAAAGAKALREVGNWGTGFTYLRNEVSSWLDQLERITKLGINVAIIGHTEISEFVNPEGNNYNKYNFACDKKIWPKLHRWADTVLFFSQEIKSVEKEDKSVAVAMEPKIFASWSAAYEAKNRYNMPKSIKMDNAYEKFMAFIEATYNVDELRKKYNIKDEYTLVQTAVLDKFKNDSK